MRFRPQFTKMLPTTIPKSGHEMRMLAPAPATRRWLDIGWALIALILLALPGPTRAVTVLPFLWDEPRNDLPNVTAWH